jgi:ADP-heptose:LPS heptosyltransferase
VLIVRNDAVGDLVVTTPILSFLADVAPQAEVDVLASASNHTLLAADSRVHRCYVSPQNTLGWIPLLRQLRARRYDVTYSLRYGRSLREGFLASGVAGRGTQKISVFRPKRYQGFFTRVIRAPRRAAHMSQRLLYVVQASLSPNGAGARQPLADYPMHLAIGAEAEEVAARFLAASGVKEFVAVNFSAREPERDWPTDACARVIRALAVDYPDLAFVLTPPASRAGDAAVVVAACAGLPVVIFPPSPNLLALAALLRKARVVITPDTAAVHIASASGRPVLGLYLRLKTRLWTPLGVPFRIVEAAPGAPISSLADDAIIAGFRTLYKEAAARDVSR